MYVKPSGVNRSKLLYEIGGIITAKAGKWLLLDLGCDGQTAKQIHSQVNVCTWTTSLHRIHQKELQGCALVNETAELPIEGLT